MNAGHLKEKAVLEEKTAKRLTRLYIVALTAVALLTITGQILIQTSINNQLSDSRIVNLAGKQRFKSQEIVKLCMIIASGYTHNTYKDKPLELKKLIDYWEKNHLGLRYGSDSMELPGNTSEKIQEM